MRNGNKVTFSHNGNHFTEHDIRGLINQISSKEVEDGHSTRVGKFGTGFITTHLLSTVVYVKGIVESLQKEFYEFEFTLDRAEKVRICLRIKSKQLGIISISPQKNRYV